MSRICVLCTLIFMVRISITQQQRQLTNGTRTLQVHILVAMQNRKQLLMYNPETYFESFRNDFIYSTKSLASSQTFENKDISNIAWLGNSKLVYVDMHLVPITETISVTAVLKSLSVSSTSAAASDAVSVIESTHNIGTDMPVANEPLFYMVGGYLGTNDVKAVTKITDFYNLAIVSSQATSPDLADRSLYPYYFRTCPSQKEEKYVLLNTLQHFGYTQVNTVFFDDSLSMDMKASIEPYLAANGIVVENSFVYRRQNMQTFRQIYASLTNSDPQSSHVWLAFVPNTYPTTRNLICALATIANTNTKTLYGDTHQLIAFSVKTETLWWHPYPELYGTGNDGPPLFSRKTNATLDEWSPYVQNCTISQVEQFLRGALFTNTPNLDPNDRPMSVFSSQLKPTQFMRAIERVLLPVNSKIPLDPLHLYHFDAVTAAAYALDEAERIMQTEYNSSLANFRYDRASSQAILRALDSISFQGVTGNIDFEPNGDRQNNDRILLQFQGNEFVRVGYFNRIAPKNTNDDPVYSNITFIRHLIFPTKDGHSPAQFVGLVTWATATNISVLVIALVLITAFILPVIWWFARRQLREAALRSALADMHWRIDPQYLSSAAGKNSKFGRTMSILSVTTASRASFGTQQRSQALLSTHTATSTNNESSDCDDDDNNSIRRTRSRRRQYIKLMYKDEPVCLFPLQPLSASTRLNLRSSSNYSAAASARDNKKTDTTKGAAAASSEQNSSSSAAFDRVFVREVLKMKSCSHDNVTRFVGIHSINAILPNNLSTINGNVGGTSSSAGGDLDNFVVMSGSRKGMLNDFIQQIAMNSVSGELDEACSFSLLNDLQQGLAAVHRLFGYHGRLTSTCCVVDHRLSLRVSDFGFNYYRQPTFYNTETNNGVTTKVNAETTDVACEHWIWTAPEQLSQMFNSISRQPAFTNQNHHQHRHSHLTTLDINECARSDIYSYGIIASEIFLLSLPFDDHLAASSADDDDSTPAIKLTSHFLHSICITPRLALQMVRTSLVQHHIATDVIDTIVNCVAAEPERRPALADIGASVRVMMRKRQISQNFTEMLMKRLETHAANLESIVDQRTQALMEEENKVRTLLYQILPPSVADALKNGQNVAPQTYESVTVYFSDIAGFTAISAESTALQVVDLLNDLYNTIDQIISTFDVYKVETIGDAYMVVSGLPEPNGTEHVVHITRMSIALVEHIAKRFHIRHRPEQTLKLRIGLHSGPCAAGVVGFVMPRYCLFGDTVNTASRMESTGEPQRIHASEASIMLLRHYIVGDDADAKLSPGKTPRNEFHIEPRGEVDIKGKGLMKTYWLTSSSASSITRSTLFAANNHGRDDEDKVLFNAEVNVDQM